MWGSGMSQGASQQGLERVASWSQTARAGFLGVQRVRNHFSKAVRCCLLTVNGGLGSRPSVRGMPTTDEVLGRRKLFVEPSGGELGRCCLPRREPLRGRGLPCPLRLPSVFGCVYRGLRPSVGCREGESQAAAVLDRHPSIRSYPSTDRQGEGPRRGRAAGLPILLRRVFRCRVH